MDSYLPRRTFIAAALALPLLGLVAACGSDGADTIQSLTTEPSPVTDPPVTDPASSLPDVVLSYTEPGGFTTAEFAFQNPPLVIITGDGQIITEAATPAVFPGPLVPQHMVSTISSDGISAVLDAADQAGLLADVEYVRNDLVADASTSTLMIESEGVRYVHESQGLGLGGPGSAESPAESQALIDFLMAITVTIDDVAGADSIGAPTPYAPDTYQIRALPVGDIASFEPEPTVETWPAEIGVALADASECLEVAREPLGDLFERADQLTFFSDGTEVYQVTVRPGYPGRNC